MLKFFKVNKLVTTLAKSSLTPKRNQQYFKLIRQFNSDNKPKDNPTDSSDNSYKKKFEDLKSKLNEKMEDAGNLKVNSFENFKQKIMVNLKFAKPVEKDKLDEKIKEDFKQSASTTDKTTAKNTQTESSSSTSTDNTDKTTSAENIDTSKASTVQEESAEEKKEEAPEVGFREKIAQSNPTVSKVVEFCIDSWEETFPSERYQKKYEQTRKQAQIAKTLKEQEMAKEYTEEELANMQTTIPEWKRQSLVLRNEKEAEKRMGNKLKEKLKEKFNETTLAKQLYTSEQYKDYSEFKSEMTQFKSDLKDNLYQNQNPILQGSLSLLDRVTSESNTAKAIREMRQIDPTFDVFELEEEAKGIFLTVYNAYLEGDLSLIEKICGEMALAYFKSLIKKREVDNVEPKYKQLWEIENAWLIGGQIPDKKLPTFTFTIQTQEIHCNLSKKDNKVVDGAEDRIMTCQYNFALTLHSDPDLATIGHKWELIELAQVGSLIALV